MSKHALYAQMFSNMRNMRGRTWAILAAIGFAVIGIVIWVGISVFSWLWSQAPTVIEQGKLLTKQATTQIEAAAPNLRGQLEALVPVAGEEVKQVENYLSGLSEQAKNVQTQATLLLPDAQNKFKQWLQKDSTILPTSDVAGVDIGPVPRLGGLVRTFYQRTDTSIEVGYVSKNDLKAASTHYRQGFKAKDYRLELLAATVNSEHYRFLKELDVYELMLKQNSVNQTEIIIKQHLP